MHTPDQNSVARNAAQADDFAAVAFATEQTRLRAPGAKIGKGYFTEREFRLLGFVSACYGLVIVVLGRMLMRAFELASSYRRSPADVGAVVVSAILLAAFVFVMYRVWRPRRIAAWPLALPSIATLAILFCLNAWVTSLLFWLNVAILVTLALLAITWREQRQMAARVQFGNGGLAAGRAPPR